MAMDGRYAGNAGAFSGGCLDGRHAEKRRSTFRLVPGWPDTQKTKQHFFYTWMADMPPERFQTRPLPDRCFECPQVEIAAGRIAPTTLRHRSNCAMRCAYCALPGCRHLSGATRPQAALHRPRCGIVRTAQCAALIAPYLVVGTCRV